MNRNDREELRENRQSLWLLVISPTIWAVHFLLCYLTAAIWIEKIGGRDSQLTTVRIAIAVYTVIALAGIGWTFWVGYRKHRYGTATVPHDFDTAEDRHRFLGFATVLLSGLSAVATFFSAIVALMVEVSH